MNRRTTKQKAFLLLSGLLCLLLAGGCIFPNKAKSPNGNPDQDTPKQILKTEISTSDDGEALKIETTVQSTDSIDKYGNTTLNITATNFFNAGFAYGDIVKLKLHNKTHTLPVVPHYHYVKTGEMALIAPRNDTRPLKAAIFYGSFAKETRIAEPDELTASWKAPTNLTYPIKATITMAHKGGYLTNMQVAELNRSTNRNDYATLTDAQYANFRAITSPLIATGKIYRSSSPIDPILGRNTFADELAQKVSIKTIWNMANSKETAQQLAGFNHSHYATCDTIYTVLGVDFTATAFKTELAKAIRYLIEHEPPYLIHCTEGKDRTGFISALLQAFTGADEQSIADDYADSFRYYYSITKDSNRDKTIMENIVASLNHVLKTEKFTDLEAAARNYLLSTGLTEEELNKLKSKLSAN